MSQYVIAFNKIKKEYCLCRQALLSDQLLLSFFQVLTAFILDTGYILPSPTQTQAKTNNFLRGQTCK